MKALYTQHTPKLEIKRFFGKASGHLLRVGELSPGHLARAMAQVLSLGWRSADPAYAARAQEAIAQLAPPREFRLLPRLPSPGQLPGHQAGLIVGRPLGHRQRRHRLLYFRGALHRLQADQFSVLRGLGSGLSVGPG
ncbi:hypothetical protein DFAR_1860004 [Desulfarculales bacterium]